MAIDIVLAIGDQPIKNGTSIVSCSRKGEYSTINTYVNNKPTIGIIEEKYTNRFDNPSYYYGGSSDGGDVV